MDKYPLKNFIINMESNSKFPTKKGGVLMNAKVSNIFIKVFTALIVLANGQLVNYSAYSGESITLHFVGMNPHVGQNLYLRAVDKE